MGDMYVESLLTLSLAYVYVFVCVWYVGKDKQRERCVIGNNTIYQAKSICQYEKGWEEEEKWRCLVKENVLFSNNGILGTQSVSLGPVGNVFVSSSNWQGTKSIMTYCWTCLYSVSHVHVLSLPQPSERTPHTVTLRQKRAVTDVWQTIDQSSGTFWMLLFFFWMHHWFEWLPFVLKYCEKLTRKSTACHSQFVLSPRSLFLIN